MISWPSVYGRRSSRLPHESRRNFFQWLGLVAGSGFVASGVPQRAEGAPAKLEIGGDIYQSIGVEPLINAKGTFTIITGSQTLPEVKRAMDEASRHYVHLDELMDAVGRRLAELTQAEWGIVTAGCAAAITHTTAACIAGSDPEKMQRLPSLAGLKSEVIMPRHSRNDYDHATRMLGVRVVEVTTAEELEAAFSERTAMVLIMASRAADQGPLRTEAIAEAAKRRSVPVLVDAAAEKLTIPSIHLQKGATMVAYSGGKCIRGPQCAGLLLGPKDILQAAWINSAPHHAFGRSLKVGKEEIMGMLAAVEMWVKRDHDAEWKQWEEWLDYIDKKVKQVPSVTTEILQPEDLSNHAPRLRIHFDAQKLGITGEEAGKVLYNGKPRIILGDASGNRRENNPSSLTIMPYMMIPGDHKIVAEAIYKVLSSPPHIEPETPPSGSPADVDGQWEATLTFIRGSANHKLVFEQKGNQILGTHHGSFLAHDLKGTVEGDRIWFRAAHPYEGTVLRYEFAGRVNGDQMEGTVSLAEYGKATFTARRHAYRSQREG